MSGLAKASSVMRATLPNPVRRTIRRCVDPFLVPVGSVAGARNAAVDSGGSVQVALTFDDGPDPVSTPLVLAALRDAEVRATFFMLSDRAVLHPDLVRAVTQAGHEVALHGPDHRRLTSMRPMEVTSSLEESKDVLQDICGQAVRWFRPPFGSQGLGTFRATRRAGLDPVVWTTEGQDWVVQSPDSIASKVLARVRGGGVVLLHDALAGDPRDTWVEDPLRHTRGDIALAVTGRLAAHGYSPVPLGDLVLERPIVRTAWFRD